MVRGFLDRMMATGACKDVAMRSYIKHVILRMSALFSSAENSKIIYYHDVGTGYTKTGTPIDSFSVHLTVARNLGYRLVGSVEELKEKKCWMVCFDDGFRGVWDHRDFFIREDIHPTVFLAVDLVEKPGYLNWDEIRELQRIGFNFQSHTWSHRSLTDVPSDELMHELADSRHVLSERLGQDVDQLCFPRGLFSLMHVKACKNAGYRYLFTSIPGEVGQEVVKGIGLEGIELVPRVLAQSADASDFRCLLQGAMTRFGARYVRKHFRS